MIVAVENNEILEQIMNGQVAYYVLQGALIVLGDNNELLYGPDKGFIPDYFTVQLNSSSRFSNKEITSFKEAVRLAYGKARNDANNRRYSIRVNYRFNSTRFEKSEMPKGLLSTAIMIFYKNTEGEVIVSLSDAFMRYNIPYNLDTDLPQKEWESLITNIQLPSSFIPTNRTRKKTANDGLDGLKALVKDINFNTIPDKRIREKNRTYLDYAGQILLKEKLLTEKTQIEFITFYNSKRNRYRGLYVYREMQKRIKLQSSCVDSIFHEYFHHLDFNFNHSGKLYKNIAEKLKSLPTLQQKIKEYEDLKSTPTTLSRPQYNSLKDFYEYYISEIEIMARLFESYIFQKYEESFDFDIRYYKLRTPFTKEEVEEVKDDFEALLASFEI